MATKEREFRDRFIQVLQNLREAGADDAEAMWLLGSLAAELMARGGQKNWNQFRGNLTQQAYSNLLTDFQSEGNALYADGKEKHAWAIQVLGVSVVAMTQKDADVRKGDPLLSEIIDSAVALFYKNRNWRPG